MKKFLPSLKASIAQSLYDEHDMKQTDIAKWLGITQAAVSKYLSKGISHNKENGALSKQIEKQAKKIAQHMAGGKMGEEEIALEVCEACVEINKDACIFHKAAMHAHAK
jgi:predicted transcriptional regulator